MRAIYVTADGAEISVDVEKGSDLMRTAIDNGVAGIIGECGGSLACATCHVFVDEDFLDRLDKPSDIEDEMLNYAEVERRSNSRLSCQIVMDEKLDGIRLTVAHPKP